MPYRVRQFDGLLTPEFVDRNAPANDMGTGDALTSFTQLPGGGYFDNYGEADSPQGIRPITRNCLIMGDTAEDRATILKAWRGKIGRRGPLTIEFDTGELWWQFARLKRCATPRREQDKAVSPILLMWETVDQFWNGISQSGDSWSVGDESFYLGDGTVGVGMNDYLYDLDSVTDTINVTLPNEGNTYVSNLYIELTTDSAMGYFEISNATTGHYMLWVDPGTISGQFSLLLDMGSKSCLVRHDSLGVGISALVGRGPYLQITTDDPHGLIDGDSCEISGTTIYDGVYHDIEKMSDTTLEVTLPDGVYLGGEIADVGNVYPVIDGWPDLTVTDRANWFLLDEGDNELEITHSVSGTSTRDYSVQFRWYDTYK